jgi:hypothetical protein
MHVSTANKGTVVHGYRELTALAESKGRKFYFESTVLGGSCVTFSDVPLRLLQASPGQISAQLPEDLLPGVYVAQVRSLATAQVNLQLAETEYHRMDTLFKDKIISERQYEQAKAAREEVENAIGLPELWKIEDETVVGSVIFNIDFKCDSTGPSDVDIYAQASSVPPNYVPYDWQERTTAVEGTPEEYLKTHHAAVSLAAALSQAVPETPVVVVISGGNIQPEKHNHICSLYATESLVDMKGAML